MGDTLAEIAAEMRIPVGVLPTTSTPPVARSGSTAPASGDLPPTSSSRPRASRPSTARTPPTTRRPCPRCRKQTAFSATKPVCLQADRRQVTLFGAMSWPKHFPPGCPSSSTPDIDREVFRLLLGTKVTAKEFQSHAERCAKGCDHCRDAPLCQRVALSVRATSLEEAIAHLGVMPRYHAIASAVLSPEHGKIKQTGNDDGHYSVWMSDAAHKDATSLFAIVHVETDKGAAPR